MIAAVNRFRIIALLMGMLWLPASSHCILEAAGRFDAHQGCESTATHSQGEPSHDECASCQFETGTFVSVKLKPAIKELLSNPLPFQVAPALERLDIPFPTTRTTQSQPPPQTGALDHLGLLRSSLPRAPGPLA